MPVTYVSNIYYNNSQYSRGYIGSELAYQKVSYFYIENLYNGLNTVSLTENNSNRGTTLEWSGDKVTWIPVTYTSGVFQVGIPNQNQKIYFRSTDGFGGRGSNTPYKTFSCSGDYSVGGGLRTLIDYTSTAQNVTCYTSEFNSMFTSDTKLKSISDLDLSNIELGGSCYNQMFKGCTGLTSIPSGFLPATTLSSSCYGGMFNGCTGITSLPSNLLPATTLTESCYNQMFKGCTGLTSIPSGFLPATTLSSSCYGGMFNGCTGITSLPSNLLPATTLTESCYGGMFAGCTGITSIPSGFLPATEVGTQCYQNMFNGCTSLTTIPSDLLNVTVVGYSGCEMMFMNCTGLQNIPYLPATTIGAYAYAKMFQGCTSLTNLPSGFNLPAMSLKMLCYNSMFYNCRNLQHVPCNMLPATTLVDRCYNSMFYNCIELLDSPYLPAQSLVNRAYASMFQLCSKLKQVRIAATSWATTNSVNWLSGAGGTTGGVLYNLGGVTMPSGNSGLPTNWKEKTLSNAFHIKNEYTGQNTIRIGKEGTPATTDLEYSVDCTCWSPVDLDNETSVVLEQDQRLYLRSSTGMNAGNNNRVILYSTAACSLHGDIFNLINYTNSVSSTIPENCFCRLFQYNSSARTIRVTDASDLDFSRIRTVDTTGCASMFASSFITTVPDMSMITTLNRSALQDMFKDCTRITVGADLSGVTAAAYSACATLYQYCSSITSATTPNVQQLANSGILTNWLSTSVPATGTVYVPTGATIDSGSSGIPSGWTRVDY